MVYTAGRAGSVRWRIAWVIRLPIPMRPKAELLISTPKTIKEIAHEVGFDDPFYLSRIFVKYVSVSPTQYRLINRKDKQA